MPHGLLKRDPTSVGKFDLLEKLGSGGVGKVYLGRHRETGQVAAVKLLKTALVDNPRSSYRFVQEFRSATKLDHPNIVRAFDMGLDGSVAYLVMEYVPGESLADRIRRAGRLPEAEAVRVVTQVAQALHYAHRRKVIHRDVKPANVLIRPDGLAKLADFGMAKDLSNDRDLTRPASGLGTPHFMAPEQYEDAKRVGPAADVYGLATTLYAAVTGQVPFAGATSLIALAKKIKGDVPSPRKLVPELSEQADDAIRRAMDPDPARRPATPLRFVKLLASRKQWGRRRGPTATPAEDRRAAVRHLCTLPSTCAVDPDTVASLSSVEDAWPAVVHDVSAGGIGLALARRFEPGTAFAIELECGGQSHTLVARVMNVRPETLGHWFHGCAFDTPLPQETLDDLLEAAR